MKAWMLVLVLIGGCQTTAFVRVQDGPVSAGMEFTSH
jgi:hypothetical protein